MSQTQKEEFTNLIDILQKRLNKNEFQKLIDLTNTIKERNYGDSMSIINSCELLSNSSENGLTTAVDALKQARSKT